MARWHIPVILASLLLALWLVGCGGGGSSTISTGVGTIQGMVSDLPLADGTRALGETITVGIDGTEIQTQVGSDGRFTLTNVPPGIHTLVAKNQQRAFALVVSVQGDRPTNIGQIELQDAGQISGIVTSAATQETLALARVVVVDAAATTTDSMPHPVRIAYTNPSGSYTIGALPTGDYLVTIGKRGYSSLSLKLTVTAGSTTVGDAALTPIVVPNSGSLAGQVSVVTEDGANKPLPGVMVRLAPVALANDPNQQQPLPPVALDGAGKEVAIYPDAPPVPDNARGWYAFTDQEGMYQIDGIPAGDYIALAIRPGFLVAHQTVAIAADETTTANFVLTPLPPILATITGKVTDDNGNPVAGAEVTAIVRPPITPQAQATRQGPSMGGMIIAPDVRMHAKTDSNGVYTLKVMPNVTAICVLKWGYKPAEVAVTPIPNGAITVDVTLEAMDVTLTGTITGKVTDKESGAPIANATIKAFLPTPADQNNVLSSTNLTTRSDEQGNYSLEVPILVSELHAGAQGYEPLRLPVTVVSGATIEVPIALTPADSSKIGTIQGTVTDMVTGEPIEGAKVVALTMDNDPTTLIAPPPGLEAFTDSDGAFTLTVPITVTALGVGKEGYAPRKISVTPVAGQTINVSVLLSPLVTEKVTLSGQVLGTAAVSAAGATVYASPVSNAPVSIPVIFSTTADEDGKYAIKLLPGVYDVSAEQGQVRTEPVRIHLMASMQLNLQLGQ